MSKILIQGCGGSSAKAELDVFTDDFMIKVKGKLYRFEIDEDGSLSVCLINGVDAKITTRYGYPSIKLTCATK